MAYIKSLALLIFTSIAGLAATGCASFFSQNSADNPREAAIISGALAHQEKLLDDREKAAAAAAAGVAP